MLRAFASRLPSPVARCYSQFTANASQPPAAPTHIQPLPYHVPRNTKGSIPVYTDVRNGGTRYLVLIRNVEGNIDALASDLAQSLFPPDSPEAQRLKIHTGMSKNIVLSGGRWKHDVIRWLLSKGF